MHKDHYTFVFGDGATVNVLAQSLEEAKNIVKTQRMKAGKDYEIKGWAYTHSTSSPHVKRNGNEDS